MSHNIAINKIDPLSRKEVATINEKDRLVISNVAHSIVVDSNYILDFIESQLSEGFVLYKYFYSSSLQVYSTHQHFIFELKETRFSTLS